MDQTLRGILDALRRASLGVSRGTVHASDDTPKLQTIDFRGDHEELLSKVENFAYPYGFNAVPVPPDEQSKTAEVIMGFLKGARSLPVILGLIDRRSRPTGGEAGQVQHYHYRGAKGTFTVAGFTHDAGPDNGTHKVIVGGSTVSHDDQQIVTDTPKKLFTGVVHLGAGSLST